MIQISQTTAGVYTLIAAITYAAAYIWGYSRASRKNKEMWDSMHEQQEVLQESNKNYQKGAQEWRQKHKVLVDTYNTLADSYASLQKEIECHLHEVHEEAERPHVDQDWWKSEEEFWKGIAQKNKEKETNIDHRYPEAGC